jgi:hypothetical protein
MELDDSLSAIMTKGADEAPLLQQLSTLGNRHPHHRPDNADGQRDNRH